MYRYKNIVLLVVLVVCMIGCSEIYHPVVDASNDLLVVEGLITNGTGPFVVKLCKAVSYSSDSTSTDNPVTGAKLSIIDNNNVSYGLTETSSGSYTTPSTFVSQVGNSYKLHIETTDGNVYESSSQELLAPQTYDSLRSNYTSESYTAFDNSTQSGYGADVRVDLFQHTSATKPKCRFTTDLTVQYMYSTPVPQENRYDTLWQRVMKCSVYQYFGWGTGYSVEGNINITDENSLSTSNAILNHQVGFIPFNTSCYGLDIAPFSVPNDASLYFYLTMNQYTLNEESFAFYKAAKEQLSATGKIFDPIASQLEGNITCINNSSKIALGLFEVSSVVSSAFFIYRDGLSTAKAQTVPLIDIPESTQYKYMSWQCAVGMPASMAADYVIIPYPSWWWHSVTW